MPRKYKSEPKTGTFTCVGCGKSFFATYTTKEPSYHDEKCHRRALAKRKAEKRKALRETPKKTDEKGSDCTSNPAPPHLVSFPIAPASSEHEELTVGKMVLPPMFLLSENAMPAMFLSR